MILALAAALPGFLAALQEPSLDDAALDARAVTIYETLAAAVDGRATAADVRAHFGPELAAVVPEAMLAQLIEGMAEPSEARLERLGSRPWEINGKSGIGYRYQVVQEHRASCVDLQLERDGTAYGLLFRPGVRRVSRAELVSETTAIEHPFALSLLLLDADGKAVERVELGRADEPVPLGSTFKVYVLAELARRVSAGELSMDDEIEIRDEWKSLPSGVLHERPVGSKVTLDELAEKMIALSDNTATDHLIGLLGRESIEARLAEYENSAPERDTPFLTTLDMFTLKALSPKRRAHVFPDGALDAVAEQWKDASSEQRRAWLDAVRAAAREGQSDERMRGSLLFAYGLATLGSKQHLAIEWFARPRDIVNLLAKAHRGELVDTRASEVFLEYYGRGTKNYPLPDVAHFGFKGGSETSLLVFSSRVQLENGRTVLGCISLFGFDPRHPVPELDRLALYNEWIRNLLEGDPPSDGADPETAEAGSAR